MRDALRAIADGVFWAAVGLLAVVAVLGPPLAWMVWSASMTDISAGPWWGFGWPIVRALIGVVLWVGAFAGLMTWAEGRWGITIPGAMPKPPSVPPPPRPPHWR